MLAVCPTAPEHLKLASLAKVCFTLNLRNQNKETCASFIFAEHM